MFTAPPPLPCSGMEASPDAIDGVSAPDRICSSTWANVILQGVNGEFNCSGAGKDVDCCIWYRDLAGVLIVPSDEFTSASRMPYSSCAGAWNGELFIFV